jgi:hypothetical protein
MPLKVHAARQHSVQPPRSVAPRGPRAVVARAVADQAATSFSDFPDVVRPCRPLKLKETLPPLPLPRLT